MNNTTIAIYWNTEIVVRWELWKDYLSLNEIFVPLSTINFAFFSFNHSIPLSSLAFKQIYLRWCFLKHTHISWIPITSIYKEFVHLSILLNLTNIQLFIFLQIFGQWNVFNLIFMIKYHCIQLRFLFIWIILMPTTLYLPTVKIVTSNLQLSYDTWRRILTETTLSQFVIKMLICQNALE